uniref:Uncharacterized protein n=1 Tax=Glossina palpalis gambiensis TaxID=67801 RepID=A0A1B0BA49_9MUSC
MGVIKEPCIVIFVTVCLSLRVGLAEESSLKRVPSNENAFQKFFFDRFDWLPWINSEKSEKPPASVFPILYNYNPSPPYGDTPANLLSHINAPAFAYSGLGMPQNFHLPGNAPPQNFHLPLNAQPHPLLSYVSGTNFLPILFVFGSKPSNLFEGLLPNMKPTNHVEGFLPSKPQITGQTGHVGQRPLLTQVPGISQAGQILHTSHIASSVNSALKEEEREQLKNESEVSTQSPAKVSEDIETSSYEDDKDMKIPFHYLYPLLAQTAVSQGNPFQRKLNDRMGLVYLRDLREGRKMS